MTPPCQLLRAESGNIRSRWELNIPHTFPLWPQGWVLRAILSVFCYGSVQLYWILRDCNKFQDLHWKDLNRNEHSPVPKCDPDTVLEAVRPWLIDILTAAIERSWSETRDASDNRLTHCLSIDSDSVVSLTPKSYLTCIHVDSESDLWSNNSTYLTI